MLPRRNQAENEGKIEFFRDLVLNLTQIRLFMNRDGFTISTIRKNSFIFTVNAPISSSIIGKRKLSIVKYSLGRLFMFPPVLYPRA